MTQGLEKLEHGGRSGHKEEPQDLNAVFSWPPLRVWFVQVTAMTLEGKEEWGHMEFVKRPSQILFGSSYEGICFVDFIGCDSIVILL